MLPFALGCTLSPGSIIFGAAAMIARSGETGVAASLLLKHAWEGVHVLCSAVLTADFGSVCLQGMGHFVDGFRALAEAVAEHDSPKAHAYALQSVLSSPRVHGLLDLWQDVRLQLLARHPTLAQRCDCVSARVGAALSEVLRMTVHLMYAAGCATRALRPLSILSRVCLGALASNPEVSCCTRPSC
jgi:hypothetical protein